MYVADIPPLDEEVLEHFGVKGMRWGFVTEEQMKGRAAANKQKSKKQSGKRQALDENDKAVLKAAGVKSSDGPAFKSKYGPDSLKKNPPGPPKRLSDNQKEMLKNALVIGGAAAATWYLYHKANKMVQDDYFRQINPMEGRGGGGGNFRKEWFQYAKDSGGRQAGLSKEFVGKLSDEPVSLKAGAIFKRVSTEAESSIRPGGFYAAYKDEDVDRYKAILPVFWKQWGKGSGTSGYVVNLKANADIKAPSPKETFEKFRGMLNDEVPSVHGIGKRRLRDYFPHFGGGDDDAVARKIFPQASLQWANKEHPASKHFFDKLRGEGYNAVVDMNDAGALAGRPMRLLDSDMFEIAGHERLSTQAIAAAQENIKAIAHAAMALMGMYTLAGEAFVAHDGVKGMKWGVRKARDVVGFNRAPKPPPTPEQQQQMRNNLVKGAIAVGAIAVGAILLKRGGFKLSSPASKKIALGGAKTAFRIVQKSGRLMASTSVKLGSTVGKGAVKGGAKVGSAVAKGGVKGVIAGSKAGARAIAQNGSKFYEKGIKGGARGVMKVGSHAAAKFSRRGAPVVQDVAKRSFNLSPTDLLLNVRADQIVRRR